MEKPGDKDAEYKEKEVKEASTRTRRRPVDPQVQDGNPAINEPVTNQTESKNRRRREHAGELDEVNQRKVPSDGWMTFVADARNEKKNDEDDDRENTANLANKDKHFHESDDDDILMIPDLEEDGDSDQRVAHAPRNVARKIPTLTELENDIKSAIPKSEVGLDLSLLLSALVPPSQLIESDTTWTFDDLLRDITDELTGTQKIVIATVTKDLMSTLGPAKITTTANNTKQKVTSQMPIDQKRKNY